MAASDLNLLVHTIRAADSAASDIEKGALMRLEESARTSDINALRFARVYRTNAVIGGLSYFESLIQFQMGDRAHSIKALGNHLTTLGYRELSVQLSLYWTAINVLKHGVGESHNRLLLKANELPFRVRNRNEFFEEGEVNFGQNLVEVDSRFCEKLAILIEDILTALKVGKGHNI